MPDSFFVAALDGPAATTNSSSNGGGIVNATDQGSSNSAPPDDSQDKLNRTSESYKQLLARTRDGRVKFNAVLNMTLPQPWDIVSSRCLVYIGSEQPLLPSF